MRKNSVWKTIPALALVLSAGGYAQQQEVAAQDLAVNNKTVAGRPAKNVVPCGIVEGNQCYARGCSMGMGGAIEFDFLYWRAENQGFNSAWMVTGPITSIATNLVGHPVYSTAARVITPDVAWDPGFRLGLGWNTTWDRFDLFFDWTWYKNHANHSEFATNGPGDPSGIGLYPVNSGLLSTYGLNGPYGANQASYKLWHNALDLELGRAYYLTKHVSFRNHIGIRAASLKQKHNSSFSLPHSFSLIPGDMAGPLAAETLRQSNKFWGIGPRAGVQAKFALGKGFEVVGKGAVALLFGQEKWRSKDLTVAMGETTATVGAKTAGMFQTLAPNLQMFLGLEWSSCLSCDQVFFGVQAGWESNYWWNQYAVNTMPSHFGAGQPVTMEGLTANFHLDF